MSERYTRVFSLPELLYSEGAPVIIMAGAILKDTQTNGVLAQLKLRSIADKTIKAATVRLSLFDTVNASLGKDIDFQYLDLAVKRNQDFGEQTPIPLPLVETRAFSVVVTKVIFTDNTIWNERGNPWEELPTTIPLEASLKNHELVKQFQMTYGGSCLYQEEKDLWRCVCGCWNPIGDETCYNCQRNATALSVFDLEELEAAAEKRIKEEEAAKQRAMEAARKARLAKEEQARKEEEERKQKAAKRKATLKTIRKKAIILASIVFVVGISIAIPEIKYELAARAESKQELLTFVRAFEAHSPSWSEAQELCKMFSTVSYEYDNRNMNVTAIFSSFQYGAASVLEDYANEMSRRMYIHADNNKVFDCYVLLYRDSKKSDLMYCSRNGVEFTIDK